MITEPHRRRPVQVRHTVAPGRPSHFRPSRGRRARPPPAARPAPGPAVRPAAGPAPGRALL